MCKFTIKGLVDEDFVNFKVPSMFIAFPHCSFKCGKCSCQNAALADAPGIEVDFDDLAKRYAENPISEAVVVGGLEPLDDFHELMELCRAFRKVTQDPIVIYTGYYPNECEHDLAALKEFGNMIVKFGRYVPGEEKHFDETLGIDLASKNQFAEKIC